MVAYQWVTLLFTKCARDVAKPCQTTSRILRRAEDARGVYGLALHTIGNLETTATLLQTIITAN
jgi:hypothetical protein